MKRRQAITLLTAGWPAVVGAAPDRDMACEHFTLGCLFRVIIDDNSPQARQAAGEAFAIAERINEACSPQMAGAQVQAFCRRPHGQAHEVGPGFFDALTQTRRLAELTDGRFDPTLGPLTALWAEARTRGRLPAADVLAKAREAVGWQHLVLDPEKRTAMLEKEGMRLDFAAVARGFAADKMLAVLAEKGFPRAVVRAGSDIRVGEAPRGAEAWRIRVTVGDSGGEKVLVVPLAKVGISTVVSMAQAVRIGGTRYSNLLDPATGLGLTRDISATVIAETTTASAALAVAACVAGPETTKESFAAWGARAVRLAHDDNGKRVVTVAGDFP